MKRLSKKQQRILEFIKEEIKAKGIPPSIREISSFSGLKSTATVHYHLDILEQGGYLERQKAKNRSIKILEKDFYSNIQNTVSVPILGKVTAGLPILAAENIEDSFPIPKQYVNDNTVFMLRIKGDSMVNAGISDNDLILVRQQSSAHNNDIIVAMVGEEATCKRFFREEGYFRLQPENDAYEPIITPEVSILGKVIGLFRSF